MTWLVESFDMQTDELLADFDLDVVASHAVERLIGPQPEIVTSDQVRVVAPLFDIAPDHWENVVGSSAGDGVFGPDRLSTALAHLVGRVATRVPRISSEPSARSRWKWRRRSSTGSRRMSACRKVRHSSASSRGEVLLRAGRPRR